VRAALDAHEVVAEPCRRVDLPSTAPAIVEKERVEIRVVARRGVDGVDEVEAEARLSTARAVGPPVVAVEPSVRAAVEALHELLNAEDLREPRRVPAAELPAGEAVGLWGLAAHQHFLELARW